MSYKYNYPETHKDETTGAMMKLDKVYEHFATYVHPKGYIVCYSPCDLHLFRTSDMIRENATQSGNATSNLLKTLYSF